MKTSPASLSNILELDSDLPSLASQAAIELDNLRLNRASQLNAVGRLADIIHATMPPAEHSWHISHLDIGSTLAVNRAVARCFATLPTSTHLDELLPHVRAVAQSLSALAEPGAVVDADAADVNTLKAFCLELSRQAATTQLSAHERPSHPYRRLM